MSCASAKPIAEGFLQDVVSGPRHHALADEPQSYGGTDRGMSPYGFLGAALGACTSMTVRMYARRKGWPLEHISVDVTHDKVHAQDAGTRDAVKVDRFHRVIRLDGALDDDQRARLLEIADKCPVHKTLEAGAEVTTEARNEDGPRLSGAASFGALRASTAGEPPEGRDEKGRERELQEVAGKEVGETPLQHEVPAALGPRRDTPSTAGRRRRSPRCRRARGADHAGHAPRPAALGQPADEGGGDEKSQEDSRRWAPRDRRAPCPRR